MLRDLDLWNGGGKMLGLVLTSLVIAIVAGALGFWAIAGTAALIANILFIIFLVSFTMSLLFHHHHRGV